MDPPSPSALAFQAFSEEWDRQVQERQVDGVFQCPPCQDWTNSNRFGPGPGPALLTPEDVARSVQALADDVLQLRCQVTNLRLALDTLSSDRPSTPVRFLEETVSALVEALRQDRVESRLLLQQLNCHFDNIQAQLLFLHRRLALAEHQVVDSSPPPISIPSSSAFATPKSALTSGTGSWSVVSPALRSLFRPQSKYGPPLPRPAHLQARTPRRGPYPAPVLGCTPLPLPHYHRSPLAGVGFSAPLPAPVLRPASLYAIYPSNRLAQTACPKALQASGSELNLADLSAAHGASQVSQILTKHPVLPKVAPNGFGSTQPLGQALRPPLAGLASAQPGAVLQETLHTQAWDSILLLWHSLCEFIAPLSQVVQELATSVNRRALTLKLLQVNSDTTVSRYVSSCLSFFSFVADLGLDLSALTQVQAVEAVMALRLSKHQDQDDPFDASSAALVHPVNTLKALRWLIKVTLLRFPDTYGGLFRALSSGPTSDRKEALALPLDFVAFLEALVLDPGVRTLQSLLCRGGSSFRVGQLALWRRQPYQMIELALRCVLPRSPRRGLSYQDDPSGYAICLSWPWHLRLLGRHLARPLHRPDSLFFVSDAPGFGAGSLDLAFAPASYASALRSLRQALSLWGHLSPAAVANYTLHSSKATALSWAAQLGLQELPRREQGHHRTNSVSLYGRDETFSALALQASLLSRIGSGWRHLGSCRKRPPPLLLPLLPQHPFCPPLKSSQRKHRLRLQRMQPCLWSQPRLTHPWLPARILQTSLCRPRFFSLPRKRFTEPCHAVPKSHKLAFRDRGIGQLAARLSSLASPFFKPILKISARTALA